MAEGAYCVKRNGAEENPAITSPSAPERRREVLGGWLCAFTRHFC